MAERLAPLRATYRWPRFDPRPDLRLGKKMAMHVSGGVGGGITSTATAMVLTHLEVWVGVERGITHEKDIVSLSALSQSKK
jgi:hypothetical protein